MGSPSAPDPVVCFSQPHGERFGSLLALPTRAICGLSRKFCLMMIYSKEQGRKPSSQSGCTGCFALLTPLTLCSLLCRCPQHAQHRHPVVGHLELGLRGQHIEAEEQAERTTHQLHSVFSASPGKHERSNKNQLLVKGMTGSALNNCTLRIDQSAARCLIVHSQTVCLALLQVTSCAWVPDGCQLFTGSKCGVITAYSNRFTNTTVGFHGDVPL